MISTNNKFTQNSHWYQIISLQSIIRIVVATARINSIDHWIHIYKKFNTQNEEFITHNLINFTKIGWNTKGRSRNKQDMIIPWTEAQCNNRPEGTERTWWPSADNQTQYPSLGRGTCRRRGRRRGPPGLRRRCSCCRPLCPTCTSSRFPRSPSPPTRTGLKAYFWAHRRHCWCHCCCSWCWDWGQGQRRGLLSSKERK